MVCYCFWEEETIAPFAETIEAEKNAHPEIQNWDEAEIQKARTALHDFLERRM